MIWRLRSSTVCHLQAEELRKPVEHWNLVKIQIPGTRNANVGGWWWCSVTQLCLTLCNPMDCSTPGFPVLHHLLELAQTHVHWVSDAIQPARLLSSPSPHAFNPSHGKFVWRGSGVISQMSHPVVVSDWALWAFLQYFLCCRSCVPKPKAQEPGMLMSEGRKDMCPSSSRDSTFVLPWPFCSVQVPSGLNDAYLYQRGQSLLLSLLIQIPISSKNTLTDIPRDVLPVLCIP